MCAGIYDRAQSAVVTLLALKNQTAHTCKSLLESLETYPPEAVISIQTACPDIYPRRVFQDLSHVSPLPYLSVRRRPKG